MDKEIKIFKQILVATDFSEQSQFAITRAVEIAKLTNAKLTILHIGKKGFLKKMIGEVIPIIGKVLITPEEYASVLLKKQVSELSKNKIKINYEIISGDYPASKILKFSKDHNFDLLILGAHGKSSIHDWFVGTTAEYAARKTKLPVLIVKKLAEKSYKKIMVPIDFSSASKHALAFANQIFPKSDIRLLHVGDHDYEDFLKKANELPKDKLKKVREAILVSLSEKIKQFINKCGVKLKQLSCDIKLGSPGEVIVDEAKKHNQDLVIMGTEGHSKRHYLFIGRVASLVLSRTDRDVLLVPPKQKK